MKKSPHGLNIDRRKGLVKNLADNGIERNKTNNSGYVRLKKRKIERLEKQGGKETEIAKLKQQIDNYLK